MVPDYSLVLGKLEDIRGYKETFNTFARDFETELKAKAKGLKGTHGGWISDSILQLVHDDLVNSGRIDYMDYDLDAMLRAKEWGNTGIYDDRTLLDDSINTINQYKKINVELERARGLDLGYTAKESSTVYQDVPLSYIGTRDEQKLTPSISTALDNIMIQKYKKK